MGSTAPRAEVLVVTFSAVDVTLRVGGAARAGGPPPMSPARGAIPVTGASVVVLAVVAVAMVVLGALFLMQARQENR